MPYSNDALIDHLVQTGLLSNKQVEAAMRAVDRKLFVPEEFHDRAYADAPLPIGRNQTISAPHMVAVMTQALKPESGNKVLEVGAGSGYQAAILSALVGEKGRVYTTERIPELAATAKSNLKGYTNVKVLLGDGSKGLHEYAPFDRIVVSCAARRIPKQLEEQLAEKGRMVIPVGNPLSAELMLVERNKELKETNLNFPCSFVPLIED
ncbi:MAG: protein-L-isoaspartate(D-aspartate) O-methyltransferase [Candidatus Diapherotrites archaeon]|nr:protein-L-isoaspartate(D-aspartate) O-methyltransferase [Candidatus Diapherotrites archaeon]